MSDRNNTQHPRRGPNMPTNQLSDDSRQSSGGPRGGQKYRGGMGHKKLPPRAGGHGGPGGRGSHNGGNMRHGQNPYNVGYQNPYHNDHGQYQSYHQHPPYLNQIQPHMQPHMQPIIHPSAGYQVQPHRNTPPSTQNQINQNGDVSKQQQPSGDQLDKATNGQAPGQGGSGNYNTPRSTPIATSNQQSWSPDGGAPAGYQQQQQQQQQPPTDHAGPPYNQQAGYTQPVYLYPYGHDPYGHDQTGMQGYPTYPVQYPVQYPFYHQNGMGGGQGMYPHPYQPYQQYYQPIYDQSPQSYPMQNVNQVTQPGQSHPAHNTSHSHLPNTNSTRRTPPASNRRSPAKQHPLSGDMKSPGPAETQTDPMETETDPPPPPPNIKDQKHQNIKQNENQEEIKTDQQHSTPIQTAVPVVLESNEEPPRERVVSQSGVVPFENEEPQTAAELETAVQTVPAETAPVETAPSSDQTIPARDDDVKEEITFTQMDVTTESDEVELEPQTDNIELTPTDPTADNEFSFGTDDLTDETFNIANKLNVTSLNKLVFFDADGLKSEEKGPKDGSMVTMPTYCEYETFMDTEAEIDRSLNYEFVNSSLKSDVIETTPDHVIETTPHHVIGTAPTQVAPIEKQKQTEPEQVATPPVAAVTTAVPTVTSTTPKPEPTKPEKVKVTKVSPVVVTPVAKVERKRSREHPTPTPIEEPKKSEKVNEKVTPVEQTPKEIVIESEIKSGEVVKTSQSVPVMTTVVPVVPVASSASSSNAAPRMSWASITKKRNPHEGENRSSQKPLHPPGPSDDEMEHKALPQIKYDPMAKKISEIICPDPQDTMSPEMGIPRGLINQANNCWVNSLLQTALVCDPLYHLLRKLLKYTSSENKSNEKTKEIAQIGSDIKQMLPTCAKLADVFEEIIHQQDTQRLAYEPREVYGHISKLNPDLSDGQHDAEEALSLLLNAMHDEIVALCKAAGHNPTITTGTEIVPEQMGDGWQTTSKSGKAIRPSITVGRTTFDDSPISAGFRGISHSSIKVTGHPSPPPTEQPFFTLQMDMGMPFVNSIDDLIKLVPKEEALDDYKLKDGRVVTATRKISLAFLPPILILHMKRFQYVAATGQVKKLDKKITIKERIEFGRDLLSPALKDQTSRPIQYQLTGIVLHHGISAEGGHYTAESKRNDKWFRIDDNKVSEVKLNEVLHTDNRRTPYLLFYKKVVQ